MNISNKRFLVIGGAGLIGSHTIDLLLKEKVREIIIFDNFVEEESKIYNIHLKIKE